MSRARTTRSRSWRAVLVAGVALALALVSQSVSAGQSPAAAIGAVVTPSTVPPGFVKTQLAHGLKDPTVLAFAPNGDIYLGEQSGAIVVYRNGAVLPAPLGTLNAFNQGETGLLGLALDPGYATNGYLYASYTTAVTSGGVTKPFTQLSRFTVINGAISLPSEKVYLRGNQVQNLHHAGNDLKIGPDGKLWWSVGDNVPSISNAQNLTNIYGKILRFNLDGSAPADNPFLSIPGAIPSIYAYGLRNPFRFTFLPDGRAMAADTGSSFWEELDTIRPGGNYGWPFYEGSCFGCGAVDPAYSYGHLPADGAVSAVAAYSGSAFPRRYGSVVFFGDYNRGDIEAVQFDPTYGTETSQTVFDSAAGTIADLVEGPDGNLYSVSIFEGTFSMISAAGPFPPVAKASAAPDAGTSPLSVQLSSAGSADPYGRPVVYSWDFGDGSPTSALANPVHTYQSDGAYSATLTVTSGGGSATASVPVVAGHAPPVATVTAPPSYQPGTPLALSAAATDPVDGPLPGSAFTWQVDFVSDGAVKPSYTAEVPGPFYGPVTGSTALSVPLPQDGSDDPTSFYRVTLTVVDSFGVTTTVTRDVHPAPATWTAGANVAGASYLVDGVLHTGGYTATDRVGTTHVLSALPVQVIGGVRYRFRGWSDGAALQDTFTATAAPSAHTALYDTVGSPLPAAWQSADLGSPLVKGGADFDPVTNSFYVDGAGVDVNGAKDQSHYVYQSLPADGSIVARVRYQTISSSWAKAGVMIRQAPLSGSAYIDALVAPDTSASTPNVNGVGCTVDGCLAPLPPVPSRGYGARMQYSGPVSATAPVLAGFSSPNKWVKLQRVGGAVTTWESVNGTAWTKIGTAKLSMTGSATIGLFVTSHNVGQLSTVAFDNVTVTGALPAAPLG